MLPHILQHCKSRCSLLALSCSEVNVVMKSGYILSAPIINSLMFKIAVMHSAGCGCNQCAAKPDCTVCQSYFCSEVLHS